MSVIQYAVEDTGLGLKNAYDLEDESLEDVHEDYEIGYLAEKAAEDYWDNHDEWESHWPLDIEIFSDGKSMGIFNVGMEYEPLFNAGRRKKS